MSITLTAGMRQNLTALQNTAKLMDTTQERLSTGKKVNSALDDPVNFFKAQDHYNRANDLSSKKDGMNEAISTIQSANTGITEIQSLLDQMKSLASAAKTSTNKSDLAKTYNSLISQVAMMANDSGYGGQNLLNGNNLSVDFNAANTHKLSVAGVSITSTGGTGIIASKTIDQANFASNTSINTAISQIGAAVDQLRTVSQTLSSSLSTISIRADFTTQMMNTLNTGGDNLTLADMNEEGANMLMLQTRQQLGVQSLSMASQAAQSVLKLV